MEEITPNPVPTPELPQPPHSVYTTAYAMKWFIAALLLVGILAGVLYFGIPTFQA